MVRFFGGGVYCGILFHFVFMNTAKYMREQQKLLTQLLEVEGAEKNCGFFIHVSFFAFSPTKDFSKGGNLRQQSPNLGSVIYGT